MRRNLLDHIYQSSTCLSGEEINTYLAGSATPEETRRVENHLLDCPLCSDAVEGYGEAGSTPLDASLEDFSVFKKKLPAEEGAKIRTLTPARIALRAAAAVAVLLLAWQGYLSLFRSPSADQLFAQFYKPYSNDISLTMRSEANPARQIHPALSGALSFYDKKQFAESQTLFEQCLNAEPDNHAARFFAGMAYFETEQWEQALAHFEKSKNAGGTYARKAAWFAILATLKTGDHAAAKTLLNDYLQGTGYMDAEAKALQEKL
jgi:tetratricopeptide (TPR) repeat protein